jgi:hypothetical protein
MRMDCTMGSPQWGQSEATRVSSSARRVGRGREATEVGVSVGTVGKRGSEEVEGVAVVVEEEEEDGEDEVKRLLRAAV